MSAETYSHHRRSSLRSAPTTSGSRSRSRSKPRRPSLGSRRNSAKSFISIKNELDPFTPSPTSSSQQNDQGGLGQLPSSNSSSNIQFTETDIPFINATLDHTLPIGYFKQDLLSVIQNLRISKWHRLPSHVYSDIKIHKMSGALTNAIYKVDPPSVVVLKNLNLHTYHFPTLLLRIYGPNVESLIDRDYELKILVRLSKQNIGPRLFGCFTNGRVEQFLDNATTLTRKDIHDKKTSARIARRMKELHQGIKLSKFEKAEGPSVWKIIDKWLKHVDELIESKTIVIDDKELFKTDFATFKKYTKAYRDWLYKRYESPEALNNALVFCHNDTQYGNLLFTSPVVPPPDKTNNNTTANNSTTSLTTNFSNLSLENLNEIKPSIQEKKQDRNLVVIDFEYSGPNVPSYDIANHFCEWMHNYNHETDTWKIFEEDYPKLDEQLNLIYSYILFYNDIQDVTKLEKQAKELFNDCIAWRGAVNIFWGLWAIIQNGDNNATKDHEIVEMGPNGEMYKIVFDPEDEESEVTVVDSDEDESSGNAGASSADVDNFEYLKYSKDKLLCFWGDLIQFGLVDKDALNKPDEVKLLPAKFYDI